ncbi:MAG: nuclear transport factor 2 family protein [Fimbriimonas sp.]
MSTPLDVALAFTHAWTAHDLATAARYVAEDVVFDGPLQQSTGSGPYLEGLTRLSEAVKGIEILAAFGDEERALLMYNLHTAPFGKLTCAKLLEIRDGRIHKDTLAFDADKVRNAKPKD